MDDMEDSGIECGVNTSDGSATAATAVEAVKLKARTGTFYYMAADILDGTSDTIHDFYHDLESFYWVFCWIVLRNTACHMKHSGEDGPALCNRLFIADHIGNAEGAKLKWFNNNDRLEIPGNVPLTTLADKLTTLASGTYPPIRFRHMKAFLTYQEVLDAFDEALRMDGCPEADWVRCTLLDKSPKTGVAPVVPILAAVPRDSSKPAPTGPRLLRSHTAQARLAAAPRSASPLVLTSYPAEPPAPPVFGPGPVTRSASKRMFAATQPSPLDDPNPLSKRSKTGSRGPGRVGSSSKRPPS
ncbi:hypothetical protein GY45DRAFT_1326574 [Cubamyces sp. BRFM 1775]|nr:hypothetical protein GY45DRAFT_1326574 [Cubamyces sp. BRFM 1775]